MTRPISKIWRLGAASVTVGGIVSTAIELANRDNRDLFVDMVGSVISLHAVYWGLVASFGSVLVFLSWPALLWIWKTPSRIKKDAEKRDLQKQNEIIGYMRTAIKELEAIEKNFTSPERISVLSETLRYLESEGFHVDNSERSKSSRIIRNRISFLIPIIEMRGLDDARAELNARRAQKIKEGC